MSNTSYGTDRYVGCGSGIFRAGEGNPIIGALRPTVKLFSPCSLAKIAHSTRNFAIVHGSAPAAWLDDTFDKSMWSGMFSHKPSEPMTTTSFSCTLMVSVTALSVRELMYAGSVNDAVDGMYA